MQKKELAINHNLLESLEEIPHTGLKYAANRTKKRLLDAHKAYQKEQDEDKPDRLIELDKERARIQSGTKNQDDLADSLEMWKGLPEYIELFNDYIESEAHELLSKEEATVDIFIHKFQKDYLKKWSPSMQQMDALEIICPNLFDVMDELYAEEEAKPKKGKKANQPADKK